MIGVLLVLGGLAAARATCFSSPGVVVAGCTCHPTCSTCGYTAFPDGRDDCIDCAAGLDLEPFYADNTGFCTTSGSNPNSTCFEDPSTTVPSCSCHSSCATCGYLSEPTRSIDCITCADSGDTIDPIFSDGTGLCVEDSDSDSDSDSDDSLCFAADARVRLRGGAERSLADVQIGEEILTLARATGALEYSAVVAVPHSSRQRTAGRLIEIASADGAVLRLSPAHLVAVADCSLSSAAPSLVQAKDVAAGDCVVDAAAARVPVSRVTAVRAATRMLSVVTMNGALPIVNGFAASSFALSDAAHAFYAAHRALYAMGFRAVLKSAIADSIGDAAAAGAVALLGLFQATA